MSDEFSILASREKKLEFVELGANEAEADSSLLAMCRRMEGRPADKDLRTQC